MPSSRVLFRPAAAAVAVICSAAGLVVAVPGAAHAADCPDIEVVFARGTSEAPGLGTVGQPFVAALIRDLPGRSVGSYAVDYAANVSQTSAGPGATALTAHVVDTAARCPATRFVVGGYSQGATVTDIALGVPAGRVPGTALPVALAPRVAAVVVFGNPLGLRRQTIATASTVYGPRSLDFCNLGDPVCGRGFYLPAHLAYGRDGSAERGATFAAGQLGASAR